MSSIALFPCNGTPWAGIVSRLSTGLDLQVYTDENLFTDTVARFGGTREKLEKQLHGRTSVFNQFTLEKEKTLASLRAVLADKLQEQENYLFSGFHTLLIPDEISEVLKVLVIDTKQQRIEVVEKEGISPREAKKKIRDHDVGAYSLSDFLFRKEAYDPSLYDLVLPVEGKGEDILTDEILRFYHSTAVLRTVQSQQAVENFKTKAAVDLALLNKGHKLAVSVNNDLTTISIEHSVFNLGNLNKELRKIATEVAGVREVEISTANAETDSIYRPQKFELPSKVLFVDDEKEFVKTVSQRLISRDVGTYGVFNGEEALNMISEDPPEVMVLDLKMPGIHGIEVLRRTKEIAPEVEVIILTGHGTVKDEHECMELGAFAYLNKPVDIELLSETIKSANDKVCNRKAA